MKWHVYWKKYIKRILYISANDYYLKEAINHL